MGKNRKFLKFKLSFFQSSPSQSPQPKPIPIPIPPLEYICPVCQTLITEPVVTGSGHTFDLTCVHLCLDLNFTPTLPDGTCPDFSTIIPNLALRTSIPNWCRQNGVVFPTTKDFSAIAEKLRGFVIKDEAIIDDDSRLDFTELTRKVNRFDSTSSEESVIVSSEFYTSGEVVNPNPNPNDLVEEDDDEFVAKFKSNDPYEEEQGAILLRKVTRNDVSARVRLCTARLLSAIGSLLISSYDKVQVNAIAAVVNLSLEKENKIKIVRSRIVPTVIELLKGRLSEAQEHAAGVIFSLSLEESNRTAIGVLGALPPLMHCLIRSDSDRTRSDSALALYYLAFDHSNRVKLVKLRAVARLLAVLRSANEADSGRVLLVLCQLAMSAEGKAAMLDGNAVEHLVDVLRRGELVSESIRENCVAALYAMSHGSLRFKAVAKEAGAVEVLKVVVQMGSERAKEKARRILVALKGRRESEVEENDEVDWEAILESAGLSRTRPRAGPGVVGKSTEF